MIILVIVKPKYHMLKVIINNIELAQSRIYRRLLVPCLVLFALYTLFYAALDAYSDHLNHPVRMMPDDRMYSEHHKDHTPNIIALFQRVSILVAEGPVWYFHARRTIPANAVNASQCRFPVSSDLSPPFI